MNKELKIPKRRRRAASLDKRKARAGYFFVAPFIIGVILIYIPILLDSLWMTAFNVAVDEPFVPLDENAFLTALKDKEFMPSLLSGLQTLLFEVPAVIIFSLFIAVVLNQKMLGRAMFRAIFFVPVIIATGVIETIFSSTEAMNDASNAPGDTGAGGGEGGIISMLDVEKLFGSMKVGGELVGIIVDLVNNVYNIINYSGVQMLIFLAGLQSISPSIYEACRIDGATGWETFWKVTFPMISPMILVNAVYTVIDAFTRDTNPAMETINEVFGNTRFSDATAMAWIYFGIVILVIALVAGIVSSFIFYQRKD